MRILVADDDLDTSESLASQLRLWRYDVNVAGDGQTALDIAAHFPPDIVLLELRTPMDGETVAQKLRGQVASHNLRIVAITEGEERMRRARSSHVFDVVIPKPCDSQLLREILAELARNSGAEGWLR